ncbi:hypothetical protein [Streptomyces sp. NPDC021224]|uniref:hypothetical protein n=1 Tax=unclassified Streptomyces TaxID=2593676 RepID=UPI0037B7D639
MTAIGDHERETAQLLAAAVAETVHLAVKPQLKPVLDRLDQLGEEVGGLPAAVARVRTAVDGVPAVVAVGVGDEAARIREELGTHEQLLRALDDRLGLVAERAAALERRLSSLESAAAAAAEDTGRAQDVQTTRLSTLRREVLIVLSVTLLVSLAALVASVAAART